MDIFIAKISYTNEYSWYQSEVIKKEYKGSLSDCHAFLSKQRKNLSAGFVEYWTESIKKLNK